MNKILEIWQNRHKIINGIYNYFLGSRKAREVAKKRLQICQSNKCGHFDKGGKRPNAFIPGKDACGICGCNSKFLTASLESICSLHEIGKEPLWKEVIL